MKVPTPDEFHDRALNLIAMTAEVEGGGVSSADRVREAQNWVSFYEEALDEAAIIAVTDTRGTILSANRKFCELSGYSEAELIGANHRLLRSGVHGPAFFKELYGTISRGNTWHGEICNRSKSGKLYWVDTTIVPHRGVDGRLQSFTAIRFDITPQKMAEQRALRLANVDPLTELPNRRRFMEVLERETQIKESEFAVGILDVDHFKDINDCLGHSAGDELLVEFAARIQGAIGTEDVVARLGGDEFAIILRNCFTREDKMARIDRIYDALSEPVFIAGEPRKLSASLGATRFPDGGPNVSELLKHADIALYTAKGLGRNCAAYFDDEMREHVESRAALLTSFERAIPHGEFKVYYQPIVSLSDGAPLKFEALLRWQHPEKGLLSPGAFQEALLEDGLAALADRYVLETVIDDIKKMKSAGIDFGAIAINASAGDFRTTEYVSRILSAIRLGEVEPKDICIEITEGMLSGRMGQRTLLGIDQLHRNGVMIAFDDFGTGFASLSHLRDVPVDIIKIDRSFISTIGDNKANRAIVASVTRLAHVLGKSVIAEGIETKAQTKMLAGMRCDYIQGYLISPPMPMEGIAAFNLSRSGERHST